MIGTFFAFNDNRRLINVSMGFGPIPLVVRSKTLVCSRSIAGIADLIPAEGMDVSFPVLVVCCVGSFFCDGLITQAEESYRVCVSVCVV